MSSSIQSSDMIVGRARIHMLLAASCWLLLTPLAAAQEPSEALATDSLAPVEVDGDVLLRVRGIQAHPASQRAAQIGERIRVLAANPSFRPESLHVEERGDITVIVGDQLVVMGLDDEEARLQGVQRSLLAQAYATRIRNAVVDYREARRGRSIALSIGRTVAAIAVAVLLVRLLLWLLNRSEARLHMWFERRTVVLADSQRVGRLWRTVHGALGLLRALALLVIAMLLLQYVLAQFPWTRGAGLSLLAYVANPLASLGQEFVAAIPNLVFLLILVIITRYVLALAGLYFAAVERGSVQIRDFEPEWAQPTFNLVRLGVIAAAAAIAYPYIPGSNSEAFKGISILAGVLLSVGSSAAIANIVAGYMLIYRRAFRVGDVVKIGDVVGRVTNMRMQVAHLQTIKGEEITIPNSTMLTSEVLNYSRPAREKKLILHTEVGVGYAVPWRQVEAMLVGAAYRTPGLLQDPPPFVLQRKLGDFAVTYQINAYTDRADGMARTYADLHRNILDQFNEHGVQIMVPAYEGDPATPKLVAKDQWFAAPAKEPESIGVHDGVPAPKY